MGLVPTVIEKNSNGERVYDIYSRLLKDRIIILCGEIDDINSNTIVAQLLYLDSINNEEISFYINSRGGDVIQGLAIIDCMNIIKSNVASGVFSSTPRCIILYSAIISYYNKGHFAIRNVFFQSPRQNLYIKIASLCLLSPGFMINCSWWRLDIFTV